MTKKIITSYATFLCLSLAMTGIMTVHASEVTGTLSSKTSDDSKTGGNIGGTVSSDSETSGNLEGTVSDDSQTTGNLEGTVSSGSGGSGGSSSGGGRSNRSNGGSSGSSSDAPSGAVLGESTINTQTPGFPNAGFAPEEAQPHTTLWSDVVTFIRNIVSF